MIIAIPNYGHKKITIIYWVSTDLAQIIQSILSPEK